MLLINHFVKHFEKCYRLQVIKFLPCFLISHISSFSSWLIKLYKLFGLQKIQQLEMKSQVFILLVLLPLLYSHRIQYFTQGSHNSNCYTQGLFFLNQTHLFQSCGLYNASYFHLVEYKPDPFEVKNSFSTQIPWKNNIFLEGATLFMDHIYLLTWQQKIVYKIEPSTFKVVQQLKWEKDGWGLTNNDTHMFATDGSNHIYVVDQNFQLLEKIAIYNKVGRRVNYINELEYVEGYLYANIYLTSKIVKIDLSQGKVIQEYDGTSLAQNEKKYGLLNSGQVLNGIAYDKDSQKFVLTGKNWRKFYQATL